MSGAGDAPRRTTSAAEPVPPALAPDLPLAEAATLAHEAACSEVELQALELAGGDARGVKIQACRLVGVDVSESRLDDVRLTDSVLHRCNLANVRARRAAVSRAELAGTRLTGIQLVEGALADVALRDCRIDLASFGLARLERVSFEGCLLAQADFAEAQLESVAFHDCDLTQADFRGARMRRCELRRSELAGLQGLSSFRGAAMEWPDLVGLAGAMAAELGIGVLEEDPG